MLPVNNTIDSFRGEYSFLSNFSRHSFVDDEGQVWRTSEHYYQAKKVSMAGDVIKGEIIITAKTPAIAKAIGAGISPENWHEISLSVMKEALKYKFDQNSDIRMKLLETGDSELIEGNTWGDVFWGQVDGKGKNMLGKLLMELRNEYRDKLHSDGSGG